MSLIVKNLIHRVNLRFQWKLLEIAKKIATIRKLGSAMVSFKDT